MQIGLEIDNDSPTGIATLTLRPDSDDVINLFPAIGMGTHFRYVDEETPNGTTDYVYELAVDDQYDTYGLPNHTTEVGVIASVTVFAVCKDLGTIGTAYARPIIKMVGTNFHGTKTQIYRTRWDTLSYKLTENPNTSVAWTWADIDNLIIGIRLYGENSGSKGACTQLYAIVEYYATDIPEIRCTQIYAEVNYSSDDVCTLTKPERISTDHARNIKMLNFWNGDREVYDISRSGKSMVLIGAEFDTSETSAIITTYTATNHFQDYTGGVHWTNAGNAVDGNTATSARTWWDNDSIYINTPRVVTDCDCKNYTITKVEMRAKIGAHGGVPNFEFTPYFNVLAGTTRTLAGTKWTNWIDVTSDPNAPSWACADLDTLRLRIKYLASPDGIYLYQGEVKVTYTCDTGKTTCEKVLCVRDMARDGAVIIIAGLSPAYFNGNFRITQFGWEKISEKPEHYKWIMSLEQAD